MNYITTKEAAKKWRITDRMVVYHYSAGRIKGAVKREYMENHCILHLFGKWVIIQLYSIFVW